MSDNKEETLVELYHKLCKPNPTITGTDEPDLVEIQRQRTRASGVISELITKLCTPTSHMPIMPISTCIHGVSVHTICPICGTQHKFTTTENITPQHTEVPSYRMGCICPPGANKECWNGFCPRKSYGTQLSSHPITTHPTK